MKTLSRRSSFTLATGSTTLTATENAGSGSSQVARAHRIPHARSAQAAHARSAEPRQRAGGEDPTPPSGLMMGWLEAQTVGRRLGHLFHYGNYFRSAFQSDPPQKR